MPAGSKALYVGSFILRLPCRASRGEPGLINNYAPSTLSLSFSLSRSSPLFSSSCLFILISALFPSLSPLFLFVSSYFLSFFVARPSSFSLFFHLDPLHPLLSIVFLFFLSLLFSPSATTLRLICSNEFEAGSPSETRSSEN